MILYNIIYIANGFVGNKQVSALEFKDVRAFIARRCRKKVSLKHVDAGRGPREHAVGRLVTIVSSQPGNR